MSEPIAAVRVLSGKEYAVSECACEKCVGMCKSRACWPTPAEAMVLMDEGYAGRMMLDWWGADGRLPYTEIICPAQVGYEGELAPSWPMGSCTMLKDGLCEVHHIKPSEGALAHHGRKYDSVNLHLEAARTWNTPEGKAAVRRWRELVK